MRNLSLALSTLVVAAIALPATGCTSYRIWQKQAELDKLVSECRQGDQYACQAGYTVQAEIADLQAFRSAMIVAGSTSTVNYSLGKQALDQQRDRGGSDNCIVTGSTIFCNN